MSKFRYLLWFAIGLLCQKYLFGIRCYTDPCDPKDTACLLGGAACQGNVCFLDISGSEPSYEKINRGCLDKSFLHGEEEGCFLVHPQTRRHFCQCRSDFCNDRVDQDTVKTIGGSRNVTCDTGCGRASVRPTQRPRQQGAAGQTAAVGGGARGRHELVCRRKTNGPFCSYDPDNRSNPTAEYGESYFTPFGSFFGWPEANKTLCIRYIFPPFAFIRDVTCYCDTDNCNRSPPPPRSLLSQNGSVLPLVTCHGCFLDCNGAGEFCGQLDQICPNDTTCRGHYCVLHVVTDRLTSNGTKRLAVVSQYCMRTTAELSGDRKEMTFESGRHGRTKVRVCRNSDYCNAFNYSGLVIGERPYTEGESILLHDNETDSSHHTHVIPNAPNAGRMAKLRKLLNYVLESLLSSNVP